MFLQSAKIIDNNMLETDHLTAKVKPFIVLYY